MQLRLLDGEGEGAPFTGCAADIDVLPMRFDDVLDDGQTQASASLVSASAFIGSVETFKNAWQIFFGNTNPVILNLRQNAVVHVVILHGGSPSLDAVVDGVDHQIAQHLKHPFFVGINHNRFFCYLGVADGDILVLSSHLLEFTRLINEFD